MDQDHAFPDQRLFQLDIISGYLTVISRIPCAMVVHCVARQKKEDSSIIDPCSMIVEKSFWASK